MRQLTIVVSTGYGKQVLQMAADCDRRSAAQFAGGFSLGGAEHWFLAELFNLRGDRWHYRLDWAIHQQRFFAGGINANRAVWWACDERGDRFC